MLFFLSIVPSVKQNTTKHIDREKQNQTQTPPFPPWAKKIMSVHMLITLKYSSKYLLKAETVKRKNNNGITNGRKQP